MYRSAFLLGIGAACVALVGGTPAFATSYYVNCSASSNGSGTEASPWNAVNSPNAHTFVAGDNLYLMRGTTCNGELEPLGSGSPSAPITVSAYGVGPQPIIDGGTTNTAAFSLLNQSYWKIEDIALVRGVWHGIDIEANNNTAIAGIAIENVTATGAVHVSTIRGDSGEITVNADGSDSATVSNVTIRGARVGNSTVSDGIYINAGNTQSMTGAKGRDVSVQDSFVSSVYGDGLLVIDADDVRLNGNVVSKSGECSNCSNANSTPGPIWVWNTTNAVMSQNESYDNTSWGAVDGGGMDIDYYNKNVTAEYNYIHDNKGYCISAFAAENTITVNSIIRFNVCVNNNNNPAAQSQGDFYLNAWDGGSFNGVQIYNNTSYWDSALASNQEFRDNAAAFTGSIPSFYKNNLVYSPLQYPGMIDAYSPITLSNNLYYSSAKSPQFWFGYNGTWWSSFSAYQSGSDEDQNSIVGDPLLGDPGYDVNNVWPERQYQPRSGSPAIRAGVNVCAGISGCSMGCNDFVGHPLPTNVWIGAMQEDGNNLPDMRGRMGRNEDDSCWADSAGSVIGANHRGECGREEYQRGHRCRPSGSR